MNVAYRPGDIVRLISEPRRTSLTRLVGQPSIITDIDESFDPPRLIIAVFDPSKRDVERIRCRREDLAPLCMAPQDACEQH